MLSTSDMIRFMETAVFLALQPYCEGDEISVGTATNVEHPTVIATRVTAEAELESFDGRFYLLRVCARDDRRNIGRGTVTRAVVSVDKFMAKLRKTGP